MLKSFFIFFLTCCVILKVYAQPGIIEKNTRNTFEQGHLRISLVTCGPGHDLWEIFGHSCIRVTDSARNDSFRDVIFNYGVFDFNHTNFFGKLLNGTLPYFLGITPFSAFKKMFAERQRSMVEEELLLDVAQKKALVAFLSTNAKPENREYKYDFVANNCATCIRDAFQKVYGNKFVFGNSLPPGCIMTYRGISEKYAYRKPMERVGLYTFLGSVIDRPIDSMQALFVPDYLRASIKNATIDGRKVASTTIQILPGHDYVPDKVNEPLIWSSIVAVLVIVGLSVKKWHKFGKFMSTAVLLVTGLTGCFILFFWFGTDHVCTKDNFNFLWACPLNLAVPFLNNKWKSKYSIVAILFILIALVLHLLRIQIITLFELLPILLALLYIHGINYRTAMMDNGK